MEPDPKRVIELMMAVITVARRVVPTQEGKCPLKSALKNLDDEIEEYEVNTFMRNYMKGK